MPVGPLIEGGGGGPGPGPQAMPDVVEDEVAPTVKIDGSEWELLEAEVVLSNRGVPDHADLAIVPAEGTAAPPTGSITKLKENGGLVGADFTLDIDNSLRADDNEVTRVFTGKVANISPYGEFSYEMIAYDPTQEPFEGLGTESGGSSLLKEHINITSAQGTLMKNLLGDSSEGTGLVLTSNLVEHILAHVGVSDYELHLTLGGNENGIGADTLLQFDTTNVPAEEAFRAAEERSASYWWFDRYGTFHFGAPDPDSYDLQWITDSSAGTHSPMWRSVRIIGSGVVSQDGWDRSAAITEEPLLLEANVAGGSGELAKPTFVYRNMEISTQKEAERAKNKIVSNLKSQQAGGTVTVVGMPEVRPYDAIVLPDTREQTFSGEKYGVKKVTHRVGGNDGFITKIEVEGLSTIHDSLTITEEPSRSDVEVREGFTLDEYYAKPEDDDGPIKRSPYQ